MCPFLPFSVFFFRIPSAPSVPGFVRFPGHVAVKLEMMVRRIARHRRTVTDPRVVDPSNGPLQCIGARRCTGWPLPGPTPKPVPLGSIIELNCAGAHVKMRIRSASLPWKGQNTFRQPHVPQFQEGQEGSWKGHVWNACCQVVKEGLAKVSSHFPRQDGLPSIGVCDFAVALYESRYLLERSFSAPFYVICWQRGCVSAVVLSLNYRQRKGSDGQRKSREKK